MSNDVSLDINQESNPVQTVAPPKEDNNMLRATDKITALYCRLSVEDTKEKGGKDDPSNSIQHHKEILINPLIQTDIFFHGCSNPLPHSCRSGRRAGDHRVIAGNRGRCPLHGGKGELLPPKCSKDSPLCMGAVFARV